MGSRWELDKDGTGSKLRNHVTNHGRGKNMHSVERVCQQVGCLMDFMMLRQLLPPQASSSPPPKYHSIESLLDGVPRSVDFPYLLQGAGSSTFLPPLFPLFLNPSKMLPVTPVPRPFLVCVVCAVEESADGLTTFAR